MTGVKARDIGPGQEGRAWGGIAVNKWAGLQGKFTDQPAFLITSTAMTWASLATKTSDKSIPFNYTLVGIHSALYTAPSSTNAKKFRVGTSTDDDKYFVTGNAKFVSGDSITATGRAKNWSSATNIATRVGTAGEKLRFTLPPTTTTTKAAGSVIFTAVIIPR